VSLWTPALHKDGSSVLTSLGMLSQLGARAVESAWIEPATWVWVTLRNCARPGQIGADLFSPRTFVQGAMTTP
jgi:hypothetical protein